MLQYSLTENLLTDDPNDYTALVQPLGTYDKEAIITEMLRRGTLLTRTDILAVLNGFEETVRDITHDGGTVNTPLFNTSFSISGVFDGALDTFDGNRHKLNVNLSKGMVMRDAESQVAIEKTGTVIPQPTILEVKDSVSGKVNEQLTPGGVVELMGVNIKIVGENADCGLWFVPASGDAVKANVIVQNKPSSLIAMIPNLSAGSYTIKEVTQYSGSNLLKSPKTSFFIKALTVSN